MSSYQEQVHQTYRKFRKKREEIREAQSDAERVKLSMECELLGNELSVAMARMPLHMQSRDRMN